VEPEVPELFFSDDLKGYGWVVRKGAFVNIGLGRQDRSELGTHVERFVERLQRRGKIASGPIGKLHGHAYLLYGQGGRPPVGDGLLLVGDAAGLAYPRSGEGIRPAVESGLLAARAIVEAAGSGDAAALEAYAAALERRFGRRGGDRATGLTGRLPARCKPWIAHRVLASRWIARNVVLDRWFLHRRDAPLAAG
jgi:flavin-dependent dehydrogenase